MKRIGLIGARGHVGGELIRLLAGHPDFELAFVSSREWAGQAVATHHPEVDSGQLYLEVTPEKLAEYPVDALVLALPNGKAAPFVAAVDANTPETVIVDLSAD